MSRVRRISLLLSLLFAAPACASDSPTIETTVVEAGPPDAPTIREETWIVGPELTDCVGETEQMCLLVKTTPDAEWELLYDPIFGFDFTPGLTSTLQVEITEVADPPADASSERYELLGIIDQRPE